MESEEAKIAEPIKKLRVLITSKRYEAAESFLAEIVRKYPQIDLMDQKRRLKMYCQGAGPDLKPVRLCRYLTKLTFVLKY